MQDLNLRPVRIKSTQTKWIYYDGEMVGDAGFEPATPWTQTKCATKLRQSPTFWKVGVDDGARTHDNRNHNPGLYQLSYNHHNKTCYLHLTGAPDRIRTYDPRLRRPLLYPTELRAHNRNAYAGFFLATRPLKKWSVMQDLNLRPLGPKPSALPSCANHRHCAASLQRGGILTP